MITLISTTLIKYEPTSGTPLPSNGNRKWNKICPKSLTSKCFVIQYELRITTPPKKTQRKYDKIRPIYLKKMQNTIFKCLQNIPFLYESKK